MDAGTRLDYLREEHLDILRFLDKWEGAVSLIASKDDARRTTALSELREMEAELQAIRNHCFSEERNLESPYRSALKKEQFHTLATEHQELGRFVQDIVLELRFATMDQTDNIAGLGRQLAEFLRRHIVYEEMLLSEIEQGLALETKQ
jgi:hemerythrin HHE cation binding domain-containing protein